MDDVLRLAVSGTEERPPAGPALPATGSPLQATPRAAAGAGSLTVRVWRAIHRRAPGRIRELGVHRRGDSLVLVGRCGTFHAKQLAQHAAMEIAPDEPLLNQIEVAD